MGHIFIGVNCVNEFPVGLPQLLVHFIDDSLDQFRLPPPERRVKDVIQDPLRYHTRNYLSLFVVVLKVD